MRCSFINPKTGKQCRADSQRGKKFCWTHDPDISEEEKREARSRGGRTAHTRMSILPKLELKYPQQVAGMMSELINLVRENKIPANKATLLKGLSDALLKSMELGEMEDRMRVIEEEAKLSQNYGNLIKKDKRI